MARASSLITYETIRASGVLGERRFQAYHPVVMFTLEGRDITQNEAWQMAIQVFGNKKLPKQSINPRFAEMERMGVIEQVGHRHCSVTGAWCQTYVATDLVPTTPKVPKEESNKKKIERLQTSVLALTETLDRWQKVASILGLVNPTPEQASARIHLMIQVQTRMTKRLNDHDRRKTS